MKLILKKIAALSAAVVMSITTLSTGVCTYAYESVNHQYSDFSSDRSTYFFRTEGGNNDIVFFDFFSPFDPTVKIEPYNPLVEYELDNKYYFKDGVLMIDIDDLEKLYDPYFDYEIENNILYITDTIFDKLVTDGFSERATTIQYTKKVWNLKIDLNESMNSGKCDYTEYTPFVGGRNKGEVIDTEIDEEKSRSDIEFTFEKGQIEEKEGKYYVPLAEVMELMGRECRDEEGYLAIMQKDLADVTMNVSRDEEVQETRIPSTSNLWHGTGEEQTEEGYTWADYMNDIADGKRTSGWMWKSFYIPSGNHFKDGNGNEITLKADRIVPFNIYVPSSYDEDETRLTYMMHGGTGNENTPTYRIMNRNVEVEQLAEKYNYIIVSPNGWTQNPIWREGQALYSFEKSFEMVMEEFPVDRDKIFITGNSLGGRGTIELAMRFPDIFRAMAPSAPKIADKAGSGKGTVITIEETEYDLSSIENMPSMIIQGTADSTTSFKTQIGTESAEGSIAKAVMPKLKNASYVTVEGGNHSYSYGSVLPAIFDFFESTLSEPVDSGMDSVELTKNSRNAYVNGEKIRLNTSVKNSSDTAMISLNDLEEILGEGFKVYDVESYDSDPEKAVNYYTVIYNNRTVNFTLDETIYRKNMERYKEDADIVKSSAGSDKDELESAPQFSKAPYEKGGKVFVPAAEFLSAFDINVEIKDENFNSKFIMAGAAVVICISGVAAYIIRNKRRAE